MYAFCVEIGVLNLFRYRTRDDTLKALLRLVLRSES